MNTVEIEEFNEALTRIEALEEVLREVIEDIEHEDHEAGDWSQRVVVRHARKVLDNQEVV